MRSVMKTCVGFLLFLFVLSPLSGKTLMDEDFADSDDISNWERTTGEWRIEDGSLVGKDCEADGFIATGIRGGDVSWTNYSVSMDVKMESRGSDWRDGPWIGIRYQNSRQAYTVGFYDRGTYLLKANDGRHTSGQNALASTPETIQDNQWHEVEISAVGNILSVSLDGECIVAARDGDWLDVPPISRGNIVLSARQHTGSPGSTEVRFRNVVVRSRSEVPEGARTLLEEQREMEKFVGEQESRNWHGVQKRVMAFYYPWYGTPEVSGHWRHWDGINREEKKIATSTHYPAIGPYDSQDPEIMARHIHQAKEHGIDTFIFSWWGKGDFSDRALPRMLEEAQEQDFKLSLYWERAPKRNGSRVEGSVQTLSYVLEKYGDHPAFLRVDGKPVIFIYGRVMGQIAWRQWKPIIEKTRAETGQDFLLIADGYGNENYARVFDGIHVYNPVGWVIDKSRNALRDEAEERYGNAVDLAHRFNKIAACTIIPGYNDTKIREPGKATGRKDGDIYRILWRNAIQAGADWVVITSWNEWHEGSDIEPSVEYGDLYLDLTAQFADQFKN